VSEARSEYPRRIAFWREAIARGERIHNLVSNLRLAAAGAAAAVAWLAFVRDAISPAWTLAPLAGFIVLVAVHARVLERKERAARARRLYERGVDRLEGRWAGSGPDGARFLADHPYARDLDVFGHGSLFQLLDTARTEAGQDTLADWLCRPAVIGEILARQAAVVELAPRVEFREALAVIAAEAHVGRTSALDRWAALSPVGLSVAVGALFAASGAVTAVLVTAALMGRAPASVVLTWLLIEIAVAARWRRPVADAVHRIDTASDDLGLFRELLETIEGAVFVAPWLAALHARLVCGGVRPSRHIARLQSLASLLDQYQHNPYFRVIGTPLLVGAVLAVAIDRWHAAHGRALAGWLKAVGELEALASFAAYAYEHPADPFPTLTTAGPVFDARAIAHPLLSESEAVPNDVGLGGQGPQVLIVSGSNMSGKSTLLRAVGVNVVLGLAGAPVRAVSLVLSPVALGATIKVEDSLLAGQSRFYSEILRIRGIVETARGPLSLLFLLDEILHGTNSYDRRIGAEAIVRALVEAGAIGLITTHDLALTELAATLGRRAANVHFEDRIVDGKMVFDYRMREGVVERSNALALMRAIGLDV
jgi:MutS domain V